MSLLGDYFLLHEFSGIFIFSFGYFSVNSFIILGGKSANLCKSSQGKKVQHKV